MDLHERERLERLVEGAEATGKNDRVARVLDEHRLAHKEVPERHTEVDPLIDALLERQLDAEADRDPARLERAAIRGLHDAGAAAGYRGDALLCNKPPDPPRGGVHRIVGGGPRRSEHRDRGTELGQRAEPVHELSLDAQHAPGVGMQPGGV